MIRAYVDAGGPVMWAVLAVWVLVLASVLDRLVYAVGRLARRPLRRVRELSARGDHERALWILERERDAASRRLDRIDALSQVAPSIGLFGTVLGIAKSFFARGGDLNLAAPEVLASGPSTALFTTVGGLVVFLFGQLFLIAWAEWQNHLERDLHDIPHPQHQEPAT